MGGGVREGGGWVGRGEGWEEGCREGGGWVGRGGRRGVGRVGRREGLGRGRGGGV